MRYLIILITLFSFYGFSQSDSQSDEKSKTILNKVSADIKNMSSFYLKFTMKTENTSTGENSHENGEGYVKGEKYYASLGETIMISNGTKVWTVVKEEKVTYQGDVDADDDAITPKKLMTIWENGFKSKYVKETTLASKKVHEINLYPVHPGEVNYHTIMLYVSVQDNQLVQAIMKTKGGSNMTYTIDKLDKNTPIVDTKFVYNPKDYPGFQLVRD